MRRPVPLVAIAALLSLLQGCGQPESPPAQSAQQGVARTDRHLAPALRTSPPTAPDSRPAERRQ
jgi:hypothetical protein